MQLQELIGGQWGEISVMLGYMFQAWNSRGPIKYRDMTLDIGTEEIGHVEMLATMVARLLETRPSKPRKRRQRIRSSARCSAGQMWPMSSWQA